MRVFFFFHPLVRYLLNRLDGGRGKNNATRRRFARGSAPRDLARILVEYGREAGPRRLLPCAGTILQFFRRRTLPRRTSSSCSTPKPLLARLGPILVCGRPQR